MTNSHTQFRRSLDTGERHRQVFVVFFGINCVIWGDKSTGAVPFGTLVALLVFWSRPNQPPAFLGHTHDSQGHKATFRFWLSGKSPQPFKLFPLGSEAVPVGTAGTDVLVPSLIRRTLEQAITRDIALFLRI